MNEYIPRIISSKIEEAAKFFPIIVVTSTPDITSSTVIYDGESFPPTTINIRDI